MSPRRGTGSSCWLGKHRWAVIPPTAPGGQESLIPCELLLCFLFPRQRLLLFLCLIPHSHTFFSSCTFFESPYFPFCPPLSLPKSCWACPIQVPPPAYFPTSLYPFFPYTFFSSRISFSRTSLRSRISHVCTALPLSKSCWACPPQVPPPAYFLPFTLPSHTSLYCGFYLDF